MRILALVKENSGCDYHRVSLPLFHMELREGDSIDYFSNNYILRKPEFEKYDVVYFNRTPNFELETLLDLKEKYNFKIVCDLDDYWSLNPNHFFYKDWKSTGMQEKIISSIYAADLCIVTNQQLKDQLVYIHNNCIVIPNALPFGHTQFNDIKDSHDKINILYAGGSSHLADLKSIRNLFIKLGSDAEFKNKAGITLAGFTIDSDRNTANWVRMENLIKRSGSYQRKYSLTLDYYMNHYNTADISLSPLEANLFNSYKSNLKIIEAGCKGIPIIVSNNKAYTQDLSMKDKGVFFCDTVADWYKNIKKLINNKNMIQDTGSQLKEYVHDNYNLFNWNHQRYYHMEKLLK